MLYRYLCIEVLFVLICFRYIHIPPGRQRHRFANFLLLFMVKSMKFTHWWPWMNPAWISSIDWHFWKTWGHFLFKIGIEMFMECLCFFPIRLELKKSFNFLKWFFFFFFIATALQKKGKIFWGIFSSQQRMDLILSLSEINMKLNAGSKKSCEIRPWNMLRSKSNRNHHHHHYIKNISLLNMFVLK